VFRWLSRADGSNCCFILADKAGCRCGERLTAKGGGCQSGERLTAKAGGCRCGERLTAKAGGCQTLPKLTDYQSILISKPS
jgi:hypothetical protein